VTPQQEFTRSDFEKAIGEEEADGLRLLVVVGGHGTFVAAFRKRPRGRQSSTFEFRGAPVPAVLAFARPMSP
jgi:hypothetical protein